MTRLNTPLRRMFGIPGMTAVHGAVSVGAPTAAMGAAPPGKGLFVRALDRHVGTPAELVDKARWAGLSWVPILTLWQFDQPPPPAAGAQQVGGSPQMPPFFQKPFNQDIAPFIAALHAAGIQAWLWGYPIARPDAVEAFAQVVGTLAKQTGAAGIIADVEASWRQVQGVETLAANLVGGLRQHSGGRPVGIMSYGWPHDHPQFPWPVFAQLADFGAPQAYDSDGKRGADFPRRATEAYQQLGFRSVVPVLPAFGAHGDTGAKITATLQSVHVPSVLWWDWFSANEQRDRFEAIQKAQVGAPASVSQVHADSDHRP